MLNRTRPSINSIPVNVTASLTEDASEAVFFNGYASDGMLPNIPDMADELRALEDYNNMPIGLEVAPNEEVGGNGDVVGGDSNETEADTNFALLSDACISKLKVDQLRKELKTRGLGVKGLKVELVERI